MSNSTTPVSIPLDNEVLDVEDADRYAHVGITADDVLDAITNGRARIKQLVQRWATDTGTEAHLRAYVLDHRRHNDGAWPRVNLRHECPSGAVLRYRWGGGIDECEPVLYAVRIENATTPVPPKRHPRQFGWDRTTAKGWRDQVGPEVIGSMRAFIRAYEDRDFDHASMHLESVLEHGLPMRDALAMSVGHENLGGVVDIYDGVCPCCRGRGGSGLTVTARTTPAA